MIFVDVSGWCDFRDKLRVIFEVCEIIFLCLLLDELVEVWEKELII